jgi:hypothetical protein
MVVSAETSTPQEGKTGQRRGLAIFHAGGHGRALAHDFLVRLHGQHGRHLHGQTARRGKHGGGGIGSHKLQFFQFFGNGLAKLCDSFSSALGGSSSVSNSISRVAFMIYSGFLCGADLAR